jgi:hypothetical protein
MSPDTLAPVATHTRETTSVIVQPTLCSGVWRLES